MQGNLRSEPQVYANKSRDSEGRSLEVFGWDLGCFENNLRGAFPNTLEKKKKKNFLKNVLFLLSYDLINRNLKKFSRIFGIKSIYLVFGEQKDLTCLGGEISINRGLACLVIFEEGPGKPGLLGPICALFFRSECLGDSHQFCKNLKIGGKMF